MVQRGGMRTPNMLYMDVTLEMSRLSGWLKTDGAYPFQLVAGYPFQRHTEETRVTLGRTEGVHAGREAPGQEAGGRAGAQWRCTLVHAACMEGPTGHWAQRKRAGSVRT